MLIKEKSSLVVIHGAYTQDRLEIYLNFLASGNSVHIPDIFLCRSKCKNTSDICSLCHKWMQ